MHHTKNQAFFLFHLLENASIIIAKFTCITKQPTKCHHKICKLICIFQKWTFSDKINNQCCESFKKTNVCQFEFDFI